MATATRDESATGTGSAPGAAPGESYYGLPAVKPSLYGWSIALYIFAGGLAGGAQIIATAADLTAVEDAALVVAAGRVLALLGAVVGGLLLIVDLHTRRRFYNMLRIFRPTSPMSIGTYVLMAFGFFSLLAVAGEWWGPDALATGGGAVAAVFGLAMATYTAPLLSATSTPQWAAAPRLLACRFAASAIATGAAALFLVARVAGGPDISRALMVLAALAVAADLSASVLLDRQYRIRGVAATLRRRPWGPVHVFGVQLLGAALPLGLYIYGLARAPEAGVAPLAASVLVLGGGLLMRGVVLHAGNASATRPTDYFTFARPDR